MRSLSTNSPDFNAKLTMVAISGCKTLQEMGAGSEERPSKVSQWKKLGM